jgi:hypothetical protein
MWERKKKLYGDNEHYSISSKLRNEKRSNEEFEIMLSNLALEEMIALRLECAARVIDHKLFGFKLWQSIPNIAKEAVLMYTYSAARTKGEAASFLGLRKSQLRKLLKDFDIKSFFEK